MTGVAPVVLAVGNNAGSVLDTILNDISQYLSIHKADTASVSIATDTSNSRSAEAVRDWLVNSGRDARIIVPDTPIRSLQKLLTRSSAFRSVELAARGARFGRVTARRDAIDTLCLIGVSGIGTAEIPGPLAIGLWSKFVDPRFGIPLRNTRLRMPGSADVALVFSPSVVLLVGEIRGYVVCIASTDLVAAELVGLAVRSAAVTDPELRKRPWEDPVVQRATELDLGIQTPDQLELRAVWASPPDPVGLTHLTTLLCTIRELLNLSGDGSEPD